MKQLNKFLGARYNSTGRLVYTGKYIENCARIRKALRCSLFGLLVAGFVAASIALVVNCQTGEVSSLDNIVLMFRLGLLK